MMVRKIVDWITSLFKFKRAVVSSTDSIKVEVSGTELLTNALTDIHYRQAEFYSQDDLVHFPDIQLYGAFKYPVVKDILNNKDVFGVSTVHLALNDVYFSADEAIHGQNKKTAVKHLQFLSKGNQFKENEFVESTFRLLTANIPTGQAFNLVDRVVNPIIFLNVMNELDLLRTFPEFNPENPNFSAKQVSDRVKSFFVDTDLLQHMLYDHLESGAKMSDSVNALIADMQTEGDLSNARIAQFLRSMIFAAVESTASFVTSFVYETFTRSESELSERTITHRQLGEIANEVLRIHTPVPFIYRTVRMDAEVLGKQLKKGDMVVLFLAAANNDPSVFEQPESFVLQREVKHLSFGRGHLACIGEFASFRIGLNILNCLRDSNVRLDGSAARPVYIIHNSMYKIEDLAVRMDD